VPLTDTEKPPGFGVLPLVLPDVLVLPELLLEELELLEVRVPELLLDVLVLPELLLEELELLEVRVPELLLDVLVLPELLEPEVLLAPELLLTPELELVPLLDVLLLPLELLLVTDADPELLLPLELPPLELLELLVPGALLASILTVAAAGDPRLAWPAGFVSDTLNCLLLPVFFTGTVIDLGATSPSCHVSLPLIGA
jgi:hypothetical protein